MVTATKKRPKSVEMKYEARLTAVKALYANAMNTEKKTPYLLALDMLGYYTDKNKRIRPDEKLLNRLIDGAVVHAKKFDDVIGKNLGKGWKIERLSPVLLAILHCAMFELMQEHNTPYKVVINEYLDITRQYMDEKDIAFVNGLLDKIAHEVRE